MVQDEQEKWDIVIKPRSGLFRLDLEEVWLYRDLLVMYIRRDIVTFYKQTVLGPLWFVILSTFPSLNHTLTADHPAGV